MEAQVRHDIHERAVAGAVHAAARALNVTLEATPTPALTRDDIGTALQWEPSKGCASDALKRAAVQWGIRRYLYRLPAVWVELDGEGHVPPAFLVRLRTRLAASGSGPAALAIVS